MLFNRNLFFILFFSIFLALATLIMVACGGGNDSSTRQSNPSPPPPSPTATPPSTNGVGSIQGMVISSARTPLNAVHIRAVKVDGPNIQLGAFSGIGPNLTFQDGVLRIDEVPAGNYRILIEKLDGRSPAFDDFRYSQFVQSNSPLISFPDEYYNGERESSTDDPLDFIEITVMGGETTQDIIFITND